MVPNSIKVKKGALRTEYVLAMNPRYAGVAKELGADVNSLKVAEISAESWKALKSQIGGGKNKKAIESLKEIIKSGDRDKLLEFSQKYLIPYSALVEVMVNLNQSLHLEHTLIQILKKAIAQLTKAGVAMPERVTSEILVSAWQTAMKNT